MQELEAQLGNLNLSVVSKDFEELLRLIKAMKLEDAYLLPPNIRQKFMLIKTVQLKSN